MSYLDNEIKILERRIELKEQLISINIKEIELYRQQVGALLDMKLTEKKEAHE